VTDAPFGVIPAFLDVRSNLAGVHLKLRLRAGTLGLLDRIGAHARLPPALRTCPLPGCRSGAVEDASHFMLHCRAMTDIRQEMFGRLSAVLGGTEPGQRWLSSYDQCTSDEHRLALLLGGPRTTLPGPPVRVPSGVATTLDRVVRNGILLCWKRRLRLLGGDLKAVSNAVCIQPTQVNKWSRRSFVGFPPQNSRTEPTARAEASVPPHCLR